MSKYPKEIYIATATSREVTNPIRREHLENAYNLGYRDGAKDRQGYQPDPLAEIDRLTARVAELEEARVTGLEEARAACAEAWAEGHKDGTFSGRRMERTGWGVPFKNPYEVQA